MSLEEVVDELLAGTQPNGYAVQSRSHNAVAASVAQRRSDWGMAIEIAAKHNDLSFLPIRAEEYDFVIRKDNKSNAIDQFIQILGLPEVVERLKLLGLDH